MLPVGLIHTLGRAKGWLPVLGAGLLLVGVCATAFGAPGIGVGGVRSLWAAVLSQPIVSYRAGADCGQFTVRIAPAAVKVTVSPDGRELWWEISGAMTHRIEDIALDDPLVPQYDILPVSDSSFVVRLQLQAYVGHVVHEGSGSVMLELARSPLVGRKIVLDPGHGGRDPGAVAQSGIREADLTLAVAEHLRVLLERAGAEVRLTRDAATDFALYSYQTMDSVERAAVANGWAADALVAIHLNSYKSPRYGGTEVWYREGGAGSARLAGALMDGLTELGLGRRGVWSGDYAVLREARMPAVLVELGFLSCPRDVAFFADPASSQLAASLMWRALLGYFR